MSNPNPPREYYEGNPNLWEDQFARAEREARQMEADAAAGEAQARVRLDREESFAAFRERHAALGRLAEVWYSHATDRERRRAVRSSPVYAALPAEARQSWDELLDASRNLVRGRDGGLVQPARELARRQAEDLQRWDPAEPEVSVDLDQIPRA